MDWVLLAYRMPREPSTPRIAVWRKLRKLGAVQLVDGLVALPADPATVEAFDWLADEVIEAGRRGVDVAGPARARSTSRRRCGHGSRQPWSRSTGRSSRTRRQAAADPTSRSLGRLRRELRAIEARDRFGVPERDEARAAVERLAAKVEAATGGGAR